MKNYRLFCRIVIQLSVPTYFLDGKFASFVPRGTILAKLTQKPNDEFDVPRGTFGMIFEQKQC